MHTQGPLDGSLYATILKSPRSPTFPPAFISNIVNNNYQVQSKSSTSLISPPPEFGNKKLLQIQEQYSSQQSHSPAPSYEEIRLPSRSSFRETTVRQQLTRPSSSLASPGHPQPDVPKRSSSVNRSASYAPSNQRQLFVSESHSGYATTREVKQSAGYESQNGGTQRNRSPLTLSIDSGISSSTHAHR